MKKRCLNLHGSHNYACVSAHDNGMVHFTATTAHVYPPLCSPHNIATRDAVGQLPFFKACGYGILAVCTYTIENGKFFHISTGMYLNFHLFTILLYTNMFQIIIGTYLVR